MTRAATYWLFFGSVAAFTGPEPGTTGTCDQVGTDDPSDTLGKITSLPVAAGTHVVAGTVLATADTTLAQSNLSAAEQELSLATAALKARQAAAGRPTPTTTPAPTAGGSRAATTAATPTAPGTLSLPEEQQAADQQRVVEAQHRREQAQQAVTAGTITAPAAGFIEAVNTAVGADPTCQEPAVVLRADELQVESPIDAGTLARLRVGQQALVSVPNAKAHATTTLEGLPTSAMTVRDWDSPALKARSGVGESRDRENPGAWAGGFGGQASRFLLELRLAAPPAGVLPGMPADVTLILDSRDHVLAVPPSAIHRDAEGTYVLVLQCRDEKENGVCRKNSSVRTSVQLGLAGDRLTEVVSGLKEDDSVVLPPQE